MTTAPWHLTPPVRTSLLLCYLEPGAPRTRIEAALVLLGHRAGALEDAALQGLLHASSGRVEYADLRVGRILMREVTDGERRRAHLALACARSSASAAQASRRTFDVLLAGVGDTGVLAERGSLTPQEHQVAMLAATGAPAREIARAACMSVRTVEHHLTRVYRKLGVRSKAELAFHYRLT